MENIWPTISHNNLFMAFHGIKCIIFFFGALPKQPSSLMSYSVINQFICLFSYVTKSNTFLIYSHIYWVAIGEWFSIIVEWTQTVYFFISTRQGKATEPLMRITWTVEMSYLKRKEKKRKNGWILFFFYSAAKLDVHKSWKTNLNRIKSKQ